MDKVITSYPSCSERGLIAPAFTFVKGVDRSACGCGDVPLAAMVHGMCQGDELGSTIHARRDAAHSGRSGGSWASIEFKKGVV